MLDDETMRCQKKYFNIINTLQYHSQEERREQKKLEILVGKWKWISVFFLLLVKTPNFPFHFNFSHFFTFPEMFHRDDQRSNPIGNLFQPNCCYQSNSTSNSSDCIRNVSDYFANFYPCGHWNTCSCSQNQHCDGNFEQQGRKSSRILPQLPLGNSVVWPLSGSCRVRTLNFDMKF